jgi:hypothetical protein
MYKKDKRVQRVSKRANSNTNLIILEHDNKDRTVLVCSEAYKNMDNQQYVWGTHRVALMESA